MVNSKTRSVLIIEDEYPARELLTKYVLACPELRLSDIAKDGAEAELLLIKNKYDLILSDINLPVKSGLAIFRETELLKTFLVFTTAYSDHAIEAFEMDALDYLLKPYSFERFRRTIDKALKFWKEENSKSKKEKVLVFTSDAARYILPLEEIIYFSANNKSTIIHSLEKDYETPKLMKEIEEKIPSQLFIRIHKSHIVNKKYILSLKYDKGGAYILQLKNEDDTNLPVGRSFAQSLKENLGF